MAPRFFGNQFPTDRRHRGGNLLLFSERRNRDRISLQEAARERSFRIAGTWTRSSEVGRHVQEIQHILGVNACLSIELQVSEVVAGAGVEGEESHASERPALASESDNKAPHSDHRKVAVVNGVSLTTASAWSMIRS